MVRCCTYRLRMGTIATWPWSFSYPLYQVKLTTRRTALHTTTDWANGQDRSNKHENRPYELYQHHASVERYHNLTIHQKMQNMQYPYHQSSLNPISAEYDIPSLLRKSKDWRSRDAREAKRRAAQTRIWSLYCMAETGDTTTITTDQMIATYPL